MAAANLCVHSRSPSCLLPLWEALQDQQVGLTQSPFKLLPLCWVLECVRFCIHLLEAECLFPTTLWLSHTQFLLACEASTWGSSSQCRTLLPQLGNLIWVSEPSLFGKNFFPLSSHLWVAHLRVWVLTICLHSSYPSHCMYLFKIFSGSLQVILIHSHSVSSCHFGVLMGGGKFRVFLLCPLGYNPPILATPSYIYTILTVYYFASLVNFKNILCTYLWIKYVPK